MCSCRHIDKVKSKMGRMVKQSMSLVWLQENLLSLAEMEGKFFLKLTASIHAFAFGSDLVQIPTPSWLTFLRLSYLWDEWLWFSYENLCYFWLISLCYLVYFLKYLPITALRQNYYNEFDKKKIFFSGIIFLTMNILLI